MARPSKPRRICGEPIFHAFGPRDKKKNPSKTIVMSVDEFETIRLMDFEDISQEECAAIMNVARTTVQAIYASARKKLAQSIVLGQELQIEGGNYSICKGGVVECPICNRDKSSRES